MGGAIHAVWEALANGTGPDGPEANVRPRGLTRVGLLPQCITSEERIFTGTVTIAGCGGDGQRTGRAEVVHAAGVEGGEGAGG